MMGVGETPWQLQCEEHDLQMPDSPGLGLGLIKGYRSGYQEWGFSGVNQKHLAVNFTQ